MHIIISSSNLNSPLISYRSRTKTEQKQGNNVIAIQWSNCIKIFSHLQVSDSCVMNETRSVSVVLVGNNFAIGLFLVLAIFTPINHCTGTRFIHSHPWYNHCLSHMVSLCYMYLKFKPPNISINEIKNAKTKNFKHPIPYQS